MNEQDNKPAEFAKTENDAADVTVEEIAAETEQRESEPFAAAQPARRTSAPWPWIAIAAIAVAAMIFVLVRDAGQASADSEVIGRMDGASITKEDLYNEMFGPSSGGQAQASSALDSLMLMKMIGLEAAKLKATVSAAEIEEEIAFYKKSYPSDEAFEMALTQNGTTMESLKKNVEVTIKLRKIFENQIKPTDDKLKAFYEENKENYGKPEQIRASHILLKTKAEVDAVLAQLKNGADFATLAKEKSTDTGSKDNGGDLDFFGRGEMNEPFETAAFALKKDELSGVVESPNGFHIIKLTDRKEADIPTYDEVKTMVKNGYLDQNMQSLVPDWFEKMKKEYHFENLLAPKAEETPSPSASASATPSASPSASANP